MKKIIIAIALIATVIALESVRPARQPVAAPVATRIQIDPTREYRIWETEQMIERVNNRINRLTAACERGRLFGLKEAEFCITQLGHFRSTLKIIREVAASGDEVKWNQAIKIVHKFEADTEDQMYAMERILNRL